MLRCNSLVSQPSADAVRSGPDVLIERLRLKVGFTFPIPHDTLGEDVIAAVVGKPDVGIDPNCLREHLLASLSRQDSNARARRG